MNQSLNKTQPQKLATPPQPAAEIRVTDVAESKNAQTTVAPSDQLDYRPPSAEWSLVVVTVVLAFFTYRLWAATQALVADTKKTSMTQSTAANEQLRVMAAQQQAMEQQAATAKESSRVLMTQGARHG
jgi:hypothetical protein